jgi:hypothetical protein
LSEGSQQKTNSGEAFEGWKWNCRACKEVVLGDKKGQMKRVTPGANRRTLKASNRRTILYHFDRRFRSQVTAKPELNLFNFRHRSLAFGIAVFGCFPAKIHREMPKNRPKRKLNQSKGVPRRYRAVARCARGQKSYREWYVQMLSRQNLMGEHCPITSGVLWP